MGLAGASAVLWWRGRVSWRFVLADAAVVAWLGANLLGCALTTGVGARDALVETLGAAYLACLYATVRITATPLLLDRFGEWFGRSAAVAAAVGLAGSTASWLGLSARLATVAGTPIPYLGQAPRAQAFTAGPQMLASILLLAIPLFIGSRLDRGWRRRDTALIVLLVLGLASTFSKTAVCAVPALCVMWASGPPAGEGVRRRRTRVWVAAATSLIVALLFFVSSHVMVVRRATVPWMSAAQLVAGQPLASFTWAGEPWVVIPTTYYFNNGASVRAVEQFWPMGVGPSGQPAFTATLQRNQRFPRSISITEPHSTYLGAVAELGAAGLVALALILIAGGTMTRRLLEASGGFRWEAAAYAGAGTAFLIEALSTDLLNCRHYWWLLAVMAARLSSRQPTHASPRSLTGRGGL